MSATVATGAGSASLGIRGKSAVTSAPQTGNSAALAVSDEEARKRSQLAKMGRYALQRQAQQLLPGYRGLSSCGRDVVSQGNAPAVDIYIDKATGKAHFANLATCKSVWACPVCAHRITEERRAELASAVALHAMKGGRMLLMSLTFPHTQDDDLKGLLSGLSDALRKFNAMRRFRNILEAVGWIGSVRALEVTYGENGWHPHAHVLMFIGNDVNTAEVVSQARDLWAKAVFDAGLGQINEHGFDVRGGDYAAEYIAKFGKEPTEAGWTVAHELTKAPVKKGRRNDSRSPFKLLEDSLQGDDQAGALFVEYVNAFKGKRQLFWSPKLRERLGMAAERTDEEILAEAEAKEARQEETELVGTLNGKDWGLVLSRNARGKVLVMAERHGMPGVKWLLDRLRGLPETDDSAYWVGVVMVRFTEEGMKPTGLLRLPG